jgi:ATP-dependent protease ClpP protease subunit
MPKTIRVYINGFIGEDFWDPDAGNTVRTVVRQVGDAKAGDTLEVHVNSLGGDFFEGLAIYANLRQFEAAGMRVVMHVDGVAASAASIIALAGQDRFIAPAALIMIHNVWTWAVGDEHDMRKAADELKLFNGRAAAVYAERTNETVESATALMDDETWMTAEQAVERGFATAVSTSAGSDDEVRARALACPMPRGLRNVPDWLRASNAPKITPDMTVRASARAAAIPPAGPSGAANPPARPGAAHKETTMEEDIETPDVTVSGPAAGGGSPGEAAVKAERTRVTAVLAILAQARASGRIPEDKLEALQGRALSEGMGTLDVKAALTDLVLAEATSEAPPSRTRTQVTGDGGERFVTGVSQAIMARAGLEARDVRNEFNGVGLQGLVALCLDRAGVRAVGLSPTAIAKQIMAMHTSSDFPLVLENVASKSVLKGYSTVEEVFEKLASRGSVSDYKTVKRVGLSEFASLARVEEGAEYEEGTFGERGASIAVAKYGRTLTVTEEMVVNDDVGAFTDRPRKMGAAAKRTVGNLFWAIYTDNPTFNGAALFSAGRKNLLTGGGSALADSGLTAAYNLFMTRTDADMAGGSVADAVIGMTPKYLVVPVALEQAALRLMTQEFVNGTGGALGGTPNTHRGRFEVIKEARLDRVAGGTTRWFLSADPGVNDTIEVSYLDGNDQPQITRYEDGKRDSISFKVRMITGVAPLDFAGIQRNDGA